MRTVGSSCAALVASLSTVVRTLVAKNRTNPDPKFVELQETLYEVWGPAFKALRDAPDNPEFPNGRKTVLKSWLELGVAAELNGVKLDFDKDNTFELYGPPDSATPSHLKQLPGRVFCAWPDCQHHFQDPGSSLRKCAGCGETRYCSRECQLRCAFWLAWS
jgi:hypothetical protein